MLVAEITGYRIEGGGVWHTLVGGKAQETLKGCGPDMNTRLAFDVK